MYTSTRTETEGQRQRSRHSDCVPVKVSAHEKEVEVCISKTKFMVPEDMHVSEFVFYVRGFMTVDRSQSVFFFTRDPPVLLPMNATMRSLWIQQRSDTDHVLHVTFRKEDTFG